MTRNRLEAPQEEKYALCLFLIYLTSLTVVQFTKLQKTSCERSLAKFLLLLGYLPLETEENNGTTKFFGKGGLFPRRNFKFLARNKRKSPTNLIGTVGDDHRRGTAVPTAATLVVVIV